MMMAQFQDVYHALFLLNIGSHATMEEEGLEEKSFWHES